MINTRYFFYIAITFPLYGVVFQLANAARCSSGRTIALEDINLDITLLEPQTTTHDEFLALLNNSRADRLNIFEREIRREFKKTELTMLQVFDQYGTDFMCFGEPTADVATFATKSVLKDYANALMLLAASIAPKYLEQWKHTTFARPALNTKTDRRLRILVMFAESYQYASALSLGLSKAMQFWKKYKEEEPLTCKSAYPSQELVGDMFWNAKIDLLLVTTSLETQSTWNAAFNPENVLLYQNETTMPDGPKYHSLGETLATFVRDRAIESACRRFPDLLGEADKRTSTRAPALEEVAPSTSTSASAIMKTLTSTSAPAIMKTLTSTSAPAIMKTLTSASPPATMRASRSVSPPATMRASKSASPPETTLLRRSAISPTIAPDGTTTMRATASAALSLQSWLFVPIGILVIVLETRLCDMFID